MTVPPRRNPLGAAGLALALVVGAPHGAHPQQPSSAISGTVVDRSTGAPLGGATVVLVGSATPAMADAGGRFAHRGLPAGTYLLQARAVGYRAGTWVIVLGDGEAYEQVFALELTPQVLPEVLVEGHAERWMAGFQERRQQGRGYFLTDQQIKATGARQLSDLLRNVPGVRAICRPSGCIIRMSRAAAECSPEYFLDGFPASYAVGPEMPVVGVIAVEIYRTLSETPMQFLRTDNQCGTIVIWSKAGP